MCFFLFFSASKTRHTRCALVTGVQTCALPLSDPRALAMAIDAWDTFDRLGSPEGELALAQVVIYLASTAKSNAGYLAFKAARGDVVQYGTLEVPMHIRNAPTKLLKQLGYGKGYQ